MWRGSSQSGSTGLLGPSRGLSACCLLQGVEDAVAVSGEGSCELRRDVITCVDGVISNGVSVGQCLHDGFVKAINDWLLPDADADQVLR
jgi:hypothetical protein